MVELLTIWQLAEDPDFRRRLQVAAAINNADTDPAGWTARNALTIAARKEIAEAYSYAVATSPTKQTDGLGALENVVTDDMILNAVKELATAPESPPNTTTATIPTTPNNWGGFFYTQKY